MKMLVLGGMKSSFALSFCEFFVQNVWFRASLLLLDLFWLGVGGIFDFRHSEFHLRDFVFKFTFLCFMVTFPFFSNYQNINNKNLKFTHISDNIFFFVHHFPNDIIEHESFPHRSCIDCNRLNNHIFPPHTCVNNWTLHIYSNWFHQSDKLLYFHLLVSIFRIIRQFLVNINFLSIDVDLLGA